MYEHVLDLFEEKQRHVVGYDAFHCFSLFVEDFPNESDLNRQNLKHVIKVELGLVQFIL